MATDKKESVEQTLERYGVWVKTNLGEINGNANLELMNIDDSENGELPITEEEERILGKLEASPYADDSTKVSGIYASEGSDAGAKSPDKIHSIELKLDALKDEIRQLKDKISELSSLPATQIESSENSGGFFDDEDDETIALTDDELVNILDSAEMTDEVVDRKEKSIEEASFDENDKTPKSDSVTVSESHDVMESPEIEQAGDESIVNLNDIEDLSDEDFEDFEEITDIDAFETDTSEDATIEDSIKTQTGEVETEEAQDSSGIIETIESDEFDEGEEVEIGLDDEEKDLADRREILDTGMEEISLGEFDIETQMDGTSDALSDLTVTTHDAEESTLEYDSSEMITSTTKIDTTTADSEASNEEDDSETNIELSDVDVADMTSDKLDEEEFEVIDLTQDEALEIVELDETEEANPEILEIVESDKPAEASPEVESMVELDELAEAGLETQFQDGAIIESDKPAEASPEAESMVELDEPAEAGLETQFQDEAIIESDKPAEASLEAESMVELDELEEAGLETQPKDDAIIELDDDLPEAVGIDSSSAKPLENSYNELPGTEEVDLDSLEALATNTKTVESEALSSIDEASEEVKPVSSELKDEIRDVLKYMDELLDSLPDKKIREFARSEHFETYKKIFEELGISD